MSSRDRRILFAVALGMALLLVAARARAAQYPGWGDTGWIAADKRDCCDTAIAIAQQYSADACVTAGGVPRPPMGGGQRGSCSWQWMQDVDGSTLSRCYGEATLWCR
jgi:hypothetical protein